MRSSTPRTGSTRGSARDSGLAKRYHYVNFLQSNKRFIGRGSDADARGATDGRQDHNLLPESSTSRHIICTVQTTSVVGSKPASLPRIEPPASTAVGSHFGLWAFAASFGYRECTSGRESQSMSNQPPADVRWIRVAGTGRTQGLPNRVLWVSESLGRAALGKEDYGLVTTGWPGVEHAVGPRFAMCF